MVDPKIDDTRSAEDRIKLLGIQLPAAPKPFGSYVEAVESAGLLFLSGMLPVEDHKPKYIGRIGNEFDRLQGRDAAYTAILNALSAAREHLGSLDRIIRVIRLGVFIATSGDALDQPDIADGASNVLKDIFGESDCGTRLVIGVSSLPFGTPIELEVILEIRR